MKQQRLFIVVISVALLTGIPVDLARTQTAVTAETSSDVRTFAMRKHGAQTSNPLSGIDASGTGDSTSEAPRRFIYFSGFEGSDGGLTGTLDWAWGTYDWDGTCSEPHPPSGAYSGTRMWGTVLNDCYNNRGNNSNYSTCVNSDPSDDSILSFSVDLTGVATATLSWWEWFDVYLDFDWAEVYVNETVVFQHCGTGYVIPSSWEQQTVDLTPYAGGVATIEFHMMASALVNRAGWYLDDISVDTEGTPLPGPTLLLLDE